MHIHAVDPSVAMHRVVRFVCVLCLVPVSETLASIGPLTENCCKLNAIHTACVGVREEGTLTARNSCHYHWASNAPTVGASLIRGQAWPNIADIACQLGHRVQIPGTPSPCHSPHEAITPLGFFANMIP